MTDLHAKEITVQGWLGKLLKKTSNPQYEISEKTVNILYALASQNQIRDDDIQEILQDMVSKSEEYETEADKYLALIRLIGIDIGFLDTDIKPLLDTLVRVANILELRSPTDTNFLFAVNAMKERKMKLENAISAERKLTSQLQMKTQATLQRNYELQKISDLTLENYKQEEADVAKQTMKAEFLPKKICEYDQKYQKLEAKLAATGLIPSIYHEALTQQNKDLQKLNKDITAMRAKLETFHNLPPDITRAKSKVDEAKKFLEKVEADLKSKIAEL